MADISTDYLVIGAGASGMAFADEVVSHGDSEVVLVDRRHAPGGHWLDSYPFVRLHQPSANYGVSSYRLGGDQVDTSGPNAGFYERASGAEIRDYFQRVLHERLLPSGKVRFLSCTDHLGVDGGEHQVRSLLTGETTTIEVRKRVVDATYTESSIPSRHTPAYSIDDGVRLVPPNDLVDLAEPATGFTVLGGGKTAMDTCCWLLDAGVDPDRIEWFRPREAWLFDRASFQPFEAVGSYMQLQGAWVESAAHATSGPDLAERLAAAGVLVRLDPDAETRQFRGATISTGEVEQLRSIERVVRGRKVQHLGTDRVVTDAGDLPADRGRVFVDCTASGLSTSPLQPIFAPGRITLQLVTIGIVPYAAATIGAVETLSDADDDHKNSLCPPLLFTGDTADLLAMSFAGISGTVARTMDPAVSEWNEATRLNPARGAAEHLDDPRVIAGYDAMGTHLGEALENLGRHAAGSS